MQFRLGYDIGPLTAQKTGVGNYTYSILRELLAMKDGPSIHGIGVTARPLDLGALDLPARHVRVPARALYAWWNATGWPKVDRLLGGVDVFHATNFYLPPVAKSKRVLSIYDLAFLVMPETSSPKVVGPFSRHIARFAREADAIVTCSEATKLDIMRHLDVPEDKIRVAYGAVDPDFVAPSPDAAADILRRSYGVNGRFILFTGTLEPRKNLPMLLQAFARIHTRIPHTLVLAGGLGWNMEGLASECDALGIKQRVLLPGYVPRDHLAAFYAAADVFVLPSRYEGFGLPLLEAMHCGCPVISCRNSSIPEVVGDAGVLCDTCDDSAMAEAINRIVEDRGYHDELVQRGYAQCQRFTWRDSANRVYQTYVDVLS